MPPVRVLIVDDSAVVRRLIGDVLASDTMVEVAGAVANGELALQAIERLNPDVVTLDIEMPVMDGIATLKAIRSRWPSLPVIMCSTLTERGAQTTMDALNLGANDYVAKPTSTGDREAGLAQIRGQLLPLVRAWGRRRVPAGSRPAGASGLADGPSAVSTAPLAASAIAGVAYPAADTRPARAVVIASSTGGPPALGQLIPRLPGTLTAPVLVVQHMPPVFTRQFALRLDGQSELRVVEAEDGMPLSAGTVFIAPGGRHMSIRQDGTTPRVSLNDDPAENSVRPAADVLMRAAASLWGGRTLSVVMTGMGYDGLAGVRQLRALGGQVIAQDEATSVVWGMPGAVVREQIATQVLPLDKIARAIEAAVTGRTAAAGARG